MHRPTEAPSGYGLSGARAGDEAEAPLGSGGLAGPGVLNGRTRMAMGGVFWLL